MSCKTFLRRKKQLVFFFLLLSAPKIFPQEKTYNIDEVIISASKAPVSLSQLARNVTVINSDQIKSIPANNIQDILKFIGSVDLRVRGAEGVQGDAAIRGGSFEQTLILINGVKITDPQTGHHNLNIPISTDNIERI